MSSGEGQGMQPGGGRADYPHLSDVEWAALERMVATLGSVVADGVLSAPPSDQRVAALGWIKQELEAERQRFRAAAVSPRPPRAEFLKLSVTPYRGSEGECLLRCLVELDAAIQAQNMTDPSLQVSFAMSCLGGRARTWAYGMRLHDPAFFPSYEDINTELRLAFEPPKNEFSARSEFLDLRQGKSDVQGYAQRSRYLVSNVVTDPIDAATQVAVFMRGLNHGPVKTYLFRDHPNTLDEAIVRSVQEDFSVRQASRHVGSAKGHRPFATRARDHGPEPMDLSAATASGARPKRADKRTLRCNRCDKAGHFAYECMAAKPAPRARRKGSSTGGTLLAKRSLTPTSSG